MSFADTYRYEVLQSRRDRSRRAFFWARIVGFALMITIAAALRAEPALRALVMEVGIEGVTQITNLQTPRQAEKTQTAQVRPQAAPRIKINRPGANEPTQPADTTALAQELARAMAAQNIGN